MSDTDEILRQGWGYLVEGLPAKALEYFTRAIETDPDCAPGYHHRGLAYGYMGDHDLAM